MTKRLYRISVVAQRVGLSEGLLRMWERRYQLLKPTRSASGYRAYSDEDVALLLEVKRLLAEGMAIGDVARMLPSVRAAARRTSGAALPGVERAGRDGAARDGRAQPRAAAALPSEAASSGVGSVEARETPSGGEGALTGAPRGAASEAPQAARWLDELVQAALASDQAKVERVLAVAGAHLPALALYEELLAPALRACGELWHRGELTVVQEHLVTHSVRSALLRRFDEIPQGAGPRVVCACLPDEEHDVGLLGAALRFRLAGAAVTYLGARTPVEDLGVALAALEPTVVVLSSTVVLPEATFLAHLRALLARVPEGTRLFVGGPGAQRHARCAHELGVSVAGVDPWPAAAPAPLSSAQTFPGAGGASAGG